MHNFCDKTIYEIYVKSFKDSNNDGIGDINGITQKLDYLENLGVDYIWLTPIFVSPQNDNGYDISDYYSIDPIFGNFTDFENLVNEAEKRQIGIMLDMVFNHTSTEHEWFQKALKGDKKYQDFYIFKNNEDDKPPTNWQSKFGGSAWEYVPNLNKWYLHLFDKTQADLNWNNPEVRQELQKIILFWKNRNVKGFRFDVINLVSKPDKFIDDKNGDGRKFYTDGPKIHEFIKEIVQDTGIGDMITVGEMSSTSINNCIKYSGENSGELSMVFHFHHLKVDYKDSDKWAITKPDFKSLKQIIYDWQTAMQTNNSWEALFLCNHDQPRAVSRFGDDKSYWEKSAKMLATLTHTLRGTPYIYQGEEIGMTNPGFKTINQYKDVESKNYYKILRSSGAPEKDAFRTINERSRDNSRTPMQWDKSEYAGFSTSEPWIDLAINYQNINVENQVNKAGSVFNHYKKLIELRKANKAISIGKIEFLFHENESIIACKRQYEDTSIFIFNNLTSKDVNIDIKQIKLNNKIVLSNYESMMLKNDTLSLRPYESLIVL